MIQVHAGQRPGNRGRSFKARKSGTLLGSVSLAACIISLASQPARAEPTVQLDGRVFDFTQGANGLSGDALIDKDPTEGENAASLSWTQKTPIRDVIAPAIELGSRGGAGGSSGSSLFSVPAKPGGDGGAISLTIERQAPVSGTLDYAWTALERSSPLIYLHSEGGTGGIGYNSWRRTQGGIGRGGDGGDVTLLLESRVSASGGANPLNKSLPAIYLESKGGHAGVAQNTGILGDDGTKEERVAVDIGGNGGKVVVTLTDTAAVSVQGPMAPAVSANSIGGNGGRARNSGGYPSNGGAGGDVFFTNSGTISTTGNDSSAVLLQSVGGAGGSGAGGAFTTGTPGGTGGRGGKIDARNYGSLATTGNYSFGIMAQSVGGIGGNGGHASFRSGGDGGGAGVSGTVDVTNTWRITTTGKGATAIMAQSIGGGNALDAFYATTPTISTGGGGAGGGSGILPFTSGGTGGAGGVGGAVTIKHSGAITTLGDAAYGVLAQSVGGGGGTGGGASGAGAFLSVALGGTGGSGGDGGAVTFNGDRGTIDTSGKGATAVLAQSVGGGGGAGGYATAKSVGYGVSSSSATGGSGGKGGAGGHVLIENGTAITTRGEAALAIQAISVGGGGGVGGGADAYAVALPAVTPSGQPLPSIAITNAIGGSGGEGGQGRTVKVYNKNAGIETFGVGSIGIQAQSVGGGGGNAGNAFAYGLAIAAPKATAFNVTNSIGGSGGGGGAGDTVVVDNDGSVRTHGNNAFAIQAQSIGGGGGNSGSASSSADALSLYRTVAFGQTIGGTNVDGGGAGGAIWFENRGQVETRGIGSTGVVLQSIGGGGGNGGAVAASATSGLSFDKTLNSLVQKLPLADAVTVVNAIGGSGGRGGSGGAVEATLGVQSFIRTYGSQADGLLIQSIGGGGGTGGGGSAVSSGKTSLTLSLGGSGGAGGRGGAITVHQDGVIETHGDASYGVYAQSVGGGGGNGGNLSAAPDKKPDSVGQLWATLKAAVGVTEYEKWAGDKKNAETKENLEAFVKDIQKTDAYKSLAEAFKNSDFYKQMQSFNKSIDDYLKKQKDTSVKRPDVSLTLSMGGDGGSGNVGGRVTLENKGLITTAGDLSHGVFAQSVGGGGGQGGVAYSSGTNKTNLGGTLGGKGGSGNLGGYVEVRNSGNIRTAGEASYGLYAQSVGGGGGVGVGALSSDNKNLVVNLTVGGNGGTGGNGGNVTVYNSGTIETQGAEAHAVVAQSIGGGGGAFMMNPSAGKAKKAEDTSADNDAASDNTIAELLKAVGIEPVAPAVVQPADKKPSDKSGSFTLGGSGGASGAGGLVTLEQSGHIRTSGEAAFGIFAQSIGGGGGISNAAGSPGGVKYAASYGGKGGSAGKGGDITLNFANNSSIQTSGNNSIAVLAQSIGGGGGYGGASVVQGFTIPVFGGSGGSSGDGGGIMINPRYQSLDIRTTGNEAHGIFAQSLGGGGGMVSDLLKTDSTVRDTLKATETILNDLVKATDGTGTIQDNIDKFPEALQAVVRLLGNDADTVNSVLTKLKDMLNTRSASSGTGGGIDIYVNGSIRTTGAGSYGIFAQSGFQQLDGTLDSSRPGGTIRVDVRGTIEGGAGDGAAIVVDGGKTNYINIREGAYVSALSNKAVISTFGSEYLYNYGTLVGDIDLVSGTTREWNSFTNYGTYISAGSGTLNISNANGTLENKGTFDIGGVGRIATATAKANGVTMGGKLLVDVDSLASGQKADLLKATRLIVDGVAIMPNAVNGLLPGNYTVMTGDTIEVRRAATAGANPASPISWSAAPDGKNVVITPTADFVGKAGSSLTKSELSALSGLQQSWNKGQVDMAGFFAEMANVNSAMQYGLTVNSLTSTEDQGQPAANQTLDGMKSLNYAQSCPLFEGTGTTLRETQCVWARVTGSRTAFSNSPGNDGSSQNGLSYRMGGQWEISPNWFLGATAAYNLTTMHTSDNLTTSRGQGTDVSVALKHQAGPWLLSAALHAGYGAYNSTNMFYVGDDISSALNTTKVWTGGMRLRAAYELALSGWYLRPYADLDVLHTYMPAYSMAGGGLAFRTDAMREWSVAFTPALEAGTRVNLGDYGWLRPYVSVGGSFISGNGLTTRVSLTDNGGPGINFASTSSIPDRMFNVGGGVQLFAQNSYEVRAEYKAQVAKDFLNQEFSVRMAVPF